jgi:lysozyme
MNHYGIDIADYQHPNGNPINYSEVVQTLMARGDGARCFVIVKAVEGTDYINPFFLTDLAGFRSAGADVAAYLFDHGQDDPAAEQQFFRRVAGNIPEAFDIEAPGGLTPTEYGAHLEVLNKLAGTSLDYVNISEYDVFYAAGDLQNVWLADPSHPDAPARSCILQQYGTAPLSGIVGQVDLDVWRGSDEQYTAFFGGATITPEPVVVNTPPVTTTTDPLEAAVLAFPDLKLNDADSHNVLKVQGLLNAFQAGLATDGVYGAKTLAAVEAFQRSHGLAVDGVAGPDTVGKLLSA